MLIPVARIIALIIDCADRFAWRKRSFVGVFDHVAEPVDVAGRRQREERNSEDRERVGPDQCVSLAPRKELMAFTASCCPGLPLQRGYARSLPWLAIKRMRRAFGLYSRTARSILSSLVLCVCAGKKNVIRACTTALLLERSSTIEPLL